MSIYVSDWQAYVSCALGIHQIGYVKLVKFLLDSGINMDLKDKEGFTVNFEKKKYIFFFETLTLLIIYWILCHKILIMILKKN